ncbi:3-deoxy-D-manno-octulosonic acid kinase [Spiribacter sp. 2438]|nr:3-deoxy-D-manno-octulosonic acid kinase [Spiribacter sp. 2438]
MNHQVVQHHGLDHSIHDPGVVDPLPLWLFDPEALATKGLIVGTSAGRRSAWFINWPRQPLVLRHYWRGGIVARFSRDVYCWTGCEQTRAFREYRLLSRLHGQGLPVPAPVAARVRRRGAVYRADLITAAIADTEPLDDRLRNRTVSDEAWQRVGAVIRRCHDAGACHADLNVRNILLDRSNNPWIIDWDRGRLRAPATHWQQHNLDRLRRSLGKDPALNAAAQKSWDALMAGYTNS